MTGGQPPDDLAPPAMSSPDIRRDAARRLGERLDRLLLSVSRVPLAAWVLLGAVALFWTYPRRLTRTSVAGLVLDDRLSVWVSRLAILAVFAFVIALAFFMIRAVLKYVEQDRWPRRAGAIELDELRRAHAQLDDDGHDLSNAADTIRILAKSLTEARDTIVYLRTELDRVHGQERDHGHGESQQAHGE